MDLVQACVSIDGNMDSSCFFPVGSSDGTSAFDPWGKMLPVVRGIST